MTLQVVTPTLSLWTVNFMILTGNGCAPRYYEAWARAVAQEDPMSSALLLILIKQRGI